MNGLDIIILVVFFASALIGALRGFTKEILSLFSWGGAISLSYVFLPIGRGFVSPYIANPMMADGAALFCIFIISLILLSIVANIIAGYIHESSFRGVDHSLGFGFGMVRGAVLICVVELVFSTFSPRHAQSETIQSARFIPMVRSGADTVLQMLPSTLQTSIIDQATKVEHQLETKVKEELKNNLSNGMQGAMQGPMQGPMQDPTQDPIQGLAQGPAQNGSPHMPNLPHPQGMPSEHLSQGDIGYQARPHGAQQAFPGSPQGAVNGGAHALPQTQLVYPHGGQVQSGMVVIRPPQPGQAPQLAPAPRMSPSPINPRYSGKQASSPPGIGQSVAPQDRQTTVDQLARLKPHSSPKTESGYTKGQRDDMNRFFQAAEGE